MEFYCRQPYGELFDEGFVNFIVIKYWHFKMEYWNTELGKKTSEISGNDW